MRDGPKMTQKITFKIGNGAAEASKVTKGPPKKNSMFKSGNGTPAIVVLKLKYSGYIFASSRPLEMQNFNIQRCQGYPHAFESIGYLQAWNVVNGLISQLSNRIL